MKGSQFVLDEVKEKYSEWLEMAGDDSPALLTDILASLLAKEMDEKSYYKERLKEFEIKVKL
ncbi:MAG TPA: hypothetical protein VGK47_14985 [Nitrososphaeraceae archaeon]